jgi:hypothetical protein
MSLSINETVRVGEGAKAEHWRVQKMDTNGVIVFRPLNLGGKLGNSDMTKKVNTLGKVEGGVTKVAVDPLGGTREAHD